MQKISKKVILTKLLSYPKNKFGEFYPNFYVVSITDINSDIEISKYIIKKGLYKNIFPGKFLLPIKKYFPVHTYLSYEINNNNLVNFINNKNVVLFKLNNFFFLNNFLILRHTQQVINFIKFNDILLFKEMFLICLLFFVD